MHVSIMYVVHIASAYTCTSLYQFEKAKKKESY